MCLRKWQSYTPVSTFINLIFAFLLWFSFFLFAFFKLSFRKPKLFQEKRSHSFVIPYFFVLRFWSRHIINKCRSACHFYSKKKTGFKAFKIIPPRFWQNNFMSQLNFRIIRSRRKLLGNSQLNFGFPGYRNVYFIKMFKVEHLVYS